jgi:AcrR family transcriptional regulator
MNRQMSVDTRLLNLSTMPQRTARRTPNRRGEGARLRADLISAASELLAELDSEEALSLRAVARRVNIAPQSVYLHFPDRATLVSAVRQARFADLTATLAAAVERTQRSALPEPDQAHAKIRALCMAYSQYAQDHPGHYQVLFGTAGTPRQQSPQLAAMPALRLLDDAVRACQPDQTPRQTPSHATICLWAALHGLVTLRRARPSFPWPDFDDLIDCLIAGQVYHSVRGQAATAGE